MSAPRKFRREEVEDLYPVTPVQQGILFHAELAPEAGLYREQVGYRMRGELDPDTFRRAWQAAVDRHPVLRTAFVSGGSLSEPHQLVLRQGEVPWVYEDLSALSPDDRDARHAALAEHQVQQAFELTQPPLIRLLLTRFDEDDYRFVFTFHHVLMDGWGGALLLRDVRVFYAAFLRGEEPELGPVPRFRDFVAWLGTQDASEAQAYWRETLAGYQAPQALGIDRPTVVGAPSVHASEDLHLTEDVTDQLAAVARESGLTLNTVVQGAWAILLSRYGATTDVVFGSTSAGRPPEVAGVQSMVGLFVNTVPSRVTVNPRAELIPWLTELQREQAEQKRYEHTPLVDILGWSDVPRGSPLFESTFTFENYPTIGSDDGGVAIDVARESYHSRTNYPLTAIAEPGPRLHLILGYDWGRFDQASILRLLGHLEVLLTSIATDPRRLISELPLLSAAERDGLLAAGPEVGTRYERDQPLHEWFEEQVGRTPDAVALVHGAAQVTYQELSRRANRVAHRLRGLGVGPEVMVGLCVERSLDMVVGVLGILKAGGAYVPLDPAHPQERLLYVIEDSGLSVVITEEGLRGRLPPTEANVLTIGGGDPTLDTEPATPPAIAVAPDNIAYVIYTSGSTGKPKGTPVTHRNVRRLFSATDGWFGFGADDVWSLFHSYAFDFSVWEVWGALGYGGRLVVVGRDVSRTPASFHDLLGRERVTVLNQTPSAFQQLVVADDRSADASTRALRYVVFGGEALNVASLASWFRRHGGERPQLVNMYGITETTVHVTYRPITQVDASEARTDSPVGRPIPDLRVHVLDPQGNLMPVGTPGEMLVSGDGLARGYLGRPDLTAERFVPDPFAEGARLYRSGDGARVLADGSLGFLGRIDQQVKIRGFRIELGEIESVLSEHEGVASAVVVARGEAGSQRLVAYTVPTASHGPTVSELRAHLAHALPDYMVPSAYVAMDALPLTPHGKVDRRALPEPDDIRPDLGADYVAPSGPQEEILAGIWERVLGVEQVGAHDDFFELGGHSLLATQVVTRARDLFGVDLPLRDLFAAPTVAGTAMAIAAMSERLDAVQAPPIVPVERSGPLPLSFSQERLWFIDRLEPGSAAYTIPTAVRLRGTVAPDRLAQALDEVARRHESLRTVFSDAGEAGAQVIGDECAIRCGLVDLTSLGEPDRDRELRRQAELEARRPFDLESGPLARAVLVKVRPDEHVLLLTMHHTVSDGWSLGVLIGELSSLYSVFRAGGPSELEELPVQFADFAAWQRDWLRGAVLDGGLAYWREQLSGAPTSLELPTDRPRPPAQTYNGAIEPVELSESVSRALVELSRREGVTPFMTLLATLQSLLHRWTGQAEIVVGTPIAGRGHSEVEGLIGYFVNTLAMRGDLGDDPSFTKLLARTRTVALGAYAHQDLPFEKLLNHLDVERDLSRTPLFQVMFVLQNAPTPVVELDDLTLEPVESSTATAKFDLTLDLTETPSGFAGSLGYNTDLFDQATAQRLVTSFVRLVEGVVSDPRRRVSELPLLTDVEREWLLGSSSDVRPDFEQQPPLHEWFDAQATRKPDAVALTFGDEQVTYRELGDRANRLARHLRARGVGPEVLVGLCVERSLGMVVAVLGILKSGGAYVPLDPAHPGERLRHVIDDSGLQVIITEEALRERLPETGAYLLAVDTCQSALAAESAVAPVVAVNPDNVAYVIYTSGSTGSPKGTPVTHRSVRRLFSATDEWFGFGDADVWSLFHSYAFDFSVWEIWGALGHGGRLVVVPHDVSRAPESFHALLGAQRISVLNQTPSAFLQLMAVDGATADESAGALRYVVFGGEALNVNDLTGWIGRHGSAGPELINMYGITETTVHVTYRPITETDLSGARVDSPVGRPIPDLRVYVRDARGDLLPVGAPGEMFVSGGGVARGYLGRPDLTAERFVPNPFVEGDRIYRTGDGARVLADGELGFLGRIDQQVKIRGFRIELGEIESVLSEHPGLRSAVVIARGDAPAQRLVAYTVAAADAAPSVTELRAHLAEKLPEYMIPAAFVALDTLPLTPHGKVDRRALPEPDQARPELGGAFVAPESRDEATLAGIWADVLGLERVGAHDNFFELGGDSILSLQIVSRARQAGLAISPKHVFQHQTVAQLAAAAGDVSVARTEQGAVTGSVPLTPIQRWFLDEDPVDPDHFNQAVLLEVPRDLDRGRLERALDALLLHHDALRSRVHRVADGWRQEVLDAEAGFPVEVMDLSDVSEEGRAAALDRQVAELHVGLSLDSGPIMRVCHIMLGAGATDRLLIVIHHLAIDGVSWRILLEDLLASYQRLELGEDPGLPAKTTSYQHWARRLHESGGARISQAEREYWLDPSRRTVPPLPRDHDGADNDIASQSMVFATLDADETRALLTDVPEVYGTQINDVLLTALLTATARWSGSESLLVDLEGHGREDLFEDVDLSRTVGWFTSIFPALLTLEASDDLGVRLRSVKEQLRAIPNRGIGYGLLRHSGHESDIGPALAEQPSAEVSFNYLGQFDQVLPDDSPFGWADESSGPTRSPRAPRSHLLEVGGLISDGRLRVSFQFSKALHSPRSIEELAADFVDSLRDLIEHCRSPEAGGFSPSDFPLARLDQDGLDQLVAKTGDVEDIYPASATQQGLLFHTLYAPESGVYFTQLSCTIEGALDAAAFERAWQSVVDRHPILRTSFHLKGYEQPLQVVHRNVRVEIPVEDWRPLGEGDRTDRLDRFLREQREVGVEIDRAPLMRIALLRLGDDVHEFVWGHHHALLDGWSMGLVLNEVLQLYDAFSSGQEIQLPHSAAYRDYIAWQQERGLGQAEEFWRDRLEGLTAPTPLGLDAPGSEDAAVLGEHASLDVRVSEAASDALRSFGRRHQVTLNTLVQGAWALLLSRYGRTNDVLFGETVAGRPTELAGVDRMVGLFINTIPVRVPIVPDESVARWLQRLQARQAEVRDHEFTPLVQIRSWSEVPVGSPLFDSLLVFENYPIDEALREGSSAVTVTSAETVERTNYPLTLVAVPGPQVALRAIFDPSVLDATTVQSLLNRFERLLEELPRDPDLPLADVDLLSPSERSRLLEEWNETTVDYGLDAPVHEQFEARAWEAPDALAVVFGRETMTYGEVDAHANRLARRLRAMGVGPEVVVGVCLERSAEVVVTLLAVLKAGGAYLPLDPTYPVDRLAYMLEDSGAPVVVSTTATFAALEGHAEDVLYLDRDADAIAGESSAKPPWLVGEETLAYVIYTSGSTGRPKGVGVPHGGLANLVAWHRRAYGVERDDRATMVAALSFDASVWELWPYLAAGASVHVADEATRLSVPELVRWLTRERMTLSFLPTPLTEAALTTAGIEGVALRSLLTGGDKLQRAPREGLPFALVNNYGPTENTVVATSAVVAPSTQAGAPSIGAPIDNTTAFVLDARAHLSPIGISGELFVGGAQLARGYLGRPDLTAERFVPDAFGGVEGLRLYRTGDLVRHLPDGQLEFKGRIDHQVKVRGFRIETGEVEAVLRQHTDVAEAVVLARQDVGDQARLVAYVVHSGDSGPSVSELRSWLRDRLPDYMVPSAFVDLVAFPLTRGGKIDRAALPAPDQVRPELDADFVAPQSRHEEVLADIWCSVLGLEKVGVRDNFFELGGNSLLLLQVHGQLDERLDNEVPIVDLFQYPTIETLARHLGGEEDDVGGASAQAAARVHARNEVGGRDGPIAVIGMAGRFPGASDVESFWANLRDGIESIHFFSDDELRAAGVDEALLTNPSFVRARGVLDDVADFDAAFFGFTPREAEITDPQHRLFLECAYEALERAGYDPARYPGLVGVYAGSSMNTYMFNLLSQPGLIETIPRLQALSGNDKDFVPTRVSYKLNLRGPSLTVQTACSTSLVAFHQACRSLLDHDCDIAMAGGVSVAVPLTAGYMYQEDGIFSPDGHCRAFDARGQGTISGHGVGIVVLKRLDEAIADGDMIHAVVRGTAINNDGSAKVGFTAPSVEGQSNVIALAHAAAGITADDVSYIEAHGTATALGDPIEVAALTRVFKNPDRAPRSCAIGALKTNVGHLDAAAGVGGVIKTVMALRHKQLPPSLHFETPNPKIDFEAGPFYVNAELREWSTANGEPRRAGVSSFGIGGTNAHAVLEEAPEPQPSGPSRSAQSLMLSAKTSDALEDAISRLVDHLERHPDADPADVAYTLRIGRGVFEHRAVTVGRDAAGMRGALRDRDPLAFWTGRASMTAPPVVFLFPGGGAQHVHMGLGLYRTEPVYAAVIDRCAEWLDTRIDFDIREFLCTDVGDDQAARNALTARLTRTDLAQPAMFAMELAMARLWMSWGVTPAACLGHSTGEYVAACLAGVLSLEDALSVVSLRGHCMEQAEPGLMLAVPLPPERLQHVVGSGLWLGAVNGPEASVLSGTPERIREAEALLVADEVECRLLPHTSHAYHSGMMTDVIEPFLAAMRTTNLSAPSIPFVSNVTGRFITDEEATDPEYWGRQTSTTVRFADGVAELRRLGEDVVFLEVGPSTSLSSLVRRQVPADVRPRVFASLRHARDDTPDSEAMERALGRAWIAGVEPDWSAYYEGERRQRVELPTYPFQRKRYWIEARKFEDWGERRGGLRKTSNVAEWFYVPGWRSSLLPEPRAADASGAGADCLILADRAGVGESVAKGLTALGYRPTLVTAGPEFEARAADTYGIDPSDRGHFDRMLAALADADRVPSRIVHLWGLDAFRPGAAAGSSGSDRVLALDSVLYLTQALQHTELAGPVTLTVVTRDAHSVIGGEPLEPMNAVVGGLANVIPQEYPDIACTCVDVSSPELADPAVPRSIAREVAGEGRDRTVAYRNRLRWTQVFDPVAIRAGAGAEVIRENGVFLITGGLGKVGLALAEYLARSAGARLVLMGRSSFPARESWNTWMAEHGDDDVVSDRIRRLQAIEELGGRVMVVQADVADEPQLEHALLRAEDELGALNGVIHAAASVGPDTLKSIQALEPEDLDGQHRPKIGGLRALDRVLEGRALDFRVVTSSLSSMLGGLRYAAYASANSFLDAYASVRNADGSPRWQSINSDSWFFGDAEVGSETEHMVMTAAEGVDAMSRAMSLTELPRVVISTGDLQSRLDRAAGAPLSDHPDEAAARARHERPELDQPYVAPSNDVEQTIADNCGLLLGIDQVGVNDNFFELGGDSLIATQLMSRLRAAFGIDLSLESLFSSRTIADLAMVVFEQMLVEDDGLSEALLAEIEELDAEGLGEPGAGAEEVEAGD